MADLPVGNEGPLNSATPVTVLSAPAAATQRVVPRGGWSVFNADSVKRDITFQKDKAGVKTVLQKTVGVSSGGVAMLDKVVVLDATDEKLENFCDVIATVQPKFDIAAMETT